METGRSLTKSERIADHAIGVLRNMNLVPWLPHDHVDIGRVRRVELEHDKGTATLYDKRERAIRYSWTKGWRRTLTIHLEKWVHAENLPPLEDEDSGQWHVERIEIRGITDEKEGSIVFNNATAVGFISQHVDSHVGGVPVPKSSFY